MMTAAIKRIGEVNHNKIINYFLVGYALVLPFSKFGVNVFEILILLTWVIQGNWKEKFLLYRSNLLLMSFSGFILLNIVSIPYASDTVFALDYILKYKHILIIFPIYSSLDTKFIKHIFSAFLIGMLFSEIVSYGIFFEFWQYKNISPHDPSPFMDHVSYSVYLSFTSILLLTRLLDSTEESIKLKIVYALFFLSSTIKLFINGGRTGQVTFLILIFLSVFMSFKNKVSAILIASILTLGIITVAYEFSPNFQNRFHQATDGIEKMLNEADYKSDGLSQRVSLWIVGIDNFKDNFLVGHGIGNDTLDILHYAKNRGYDPSFLSKFGDNHNMFLTYGLQFGIVGILLFFLIFHSIGSLKFKSNKHKILSLTFIVGYFLWSLGNTTFHTMNGMTFFALFAGLFNTISYIETKKKTIQFQIN